MMALPRPRFARRIVLETRTDNDCTYDSDRRVGIAEHSSPVEVSRDD